MRRIFTIRFETDDPAVTTGLIQFAIASLAARCEDEHNKSNVDIKLDIHERIVFDGRYVGMPRR